MLRRRRNAGEAEPEVTEGQELEAEQAGDDDPEPDWPAGGPWDCEQDYPEAERFDCGSLLIPLREGFDVQVHIAAEMGVWVAVIRGDSGMQLQAFAAPKSGGLWREIRAEIADNVAESGGRSEEAAGRFGPELRAWVPAGDPADPAAGAGPQPVRFLGADGPRWFLRGVISGAAALDDSAAAALEDIFADVVVVRGAHPAPPREQLEIKLPEAAQQALEAGLAESGEEPAWGLVNPFERGPEITEIR